MCVIFSVCYRPMRPIGCYYGREQRSLLWERRLGKSEAYMKILGKEAFLSRHLGKIQPNERSSGSLCSAAAREPESLRAGIGPAEAGGRNLRRERARHEGRRPDTGGQRIPVSGRDDRRSTAISGRCSAFAIHFLFHL